MTGFGVDVARVIEQGHLFVAMRATEGSPDAHPIAVMTAVAPPEGTTVQIAPICQASDEPLSDGLMVEFISPNTPRKVGRCLARVAEVAEDRSGQSYVVLDVGSGLGVNPGDYYSLLGQAVSSGGYVPVGIDTDRDGVCQIPLDSSHLKPQSSHCVVLEKPESGVFRGSFAIWMESSVPEEPSVSGSACRAGTAKVDVDGGALCVGINEVTVEEYERCLDAGKCRVPGGGPDCNYKKSDRAQHPVNCVSYHQAESYCRWAGGRVPSKSEWETLASSRDAVTDYPWGNSKPNCELAVFQEDRNAKDGCGVGSTAPVGSRPQGQNTAGIDDLAGNVREWTSTRQDDGLVVTKGGGWTDLSVGALTIARDSPTQPNQQARNVGVRCIWEPGA